MDLEGWYRRWDPSWFMLARLASPTIDAEIRKQSLNIAKRQPLTIVGDLRNVHRANADPTQLSFFQFLPETARLYRSIPIAFSTAELSTRSDSHAVVIANNVQYRPGTREVDTAQDVQKLARVLSKLDPLICNLLTCEGIKKNVDRNGNLTRFPFIFQIPPVISEVQRKIEAPQDSPETYCMVCVPLGSWLHGLYWTHTV